MPLQTVYLVAAALGAVIPLGFFAQHFGAAGFGLPDFVAALFANPAAGGFTADLLISSFVFWIAMFAHRDGPSAWPFIALNLTIGLSCALPAWLWAIERRRATSAG